MVVFYKVIAHAAFEEQRIVQQMLKMDLEKVDVKHPSTVGLSLPSTLPNSPRAFASTTFSPGAGSTSGGFEFADPDVLPPVSKPRMFDRARAIHTLHTHLKGALGAVGQTTRDSRFKETTAAIICRNPNSNPNPYSRLPNDSRISVSMKRNMPFYRNLPSNTGRNCRIIPNF